MGPRGSGVVSLARRIAARKRARSSTWPSSAFAAAVIQRPALYITAVKYAGGFLPLASASVRKVWLAGGGGGGTQIFWTTRPPASSKTRWKPPLHSWPKGLSMATTATRRYLRVLAA